MYKLIISTAVNKVLSISFVSEIDEHRDDCTVIKIITVEVHVKIWLKDLFSFVDYPNKTCLGFDSNLTTKKNSDFVALTRVNGLEHRKNVWNCFSWYVSHCKPNVIRQSSLCDQNVYKLLTEFLHYFSRSFFLQNLYIKKVNGVSKWESQQELTYLFML